MSDWMTQHRRETTEEYGAGTLDLAMCSYRCPSCSAQAADNSMHVVFDVGYADLPSLIRDATSFTEGMAASEAPVCPTCEVATRLEHLDYHAYVGGPNRDLVVRVIPATESSQASSSEVYWWDPRGGHEALSGLGPEEQTDFALSVLRRRAGVESMKETPDFETIGERAKSALETSPGHPVLIELGWELLQYGMASTAGAIAEAHIRAHPRDAAGHAFLGEIIAMSVNHRAMPPEVLEDGVRSLERALALDSEHVQATVSLANCHRLRGDLDSARRTFCDLLERQPDCAPAHYNLGMLEFESGNHAEALSHLEQGEDLDLEDPDYPMARARVLMALRRKRDARQAVDRVRELDPDDPRIQEIEAEIDA